MNSALAIYEALLQANVPPPAARGVAETLESDMTASMATKQDLQAFEERIDLKFQNVELRLVNLEFRLVMKLGVLMTVLFSVAGGAAALLR